MKPMRPPHVSCLRASCISSRIVLIQALLHVTYLQVNSTPDNTRGARGRTAKATASEAVHAGFNMSFSQMCRLANHQHCIMIPSVIAVPMQVTHAQGFWQTGQASIHSAARLQQIRRGCRASCAHLLLLRVGRCRSCCSLCVARRLHRRQRGCLPEPRCIHGISEPALRISQSLKG